MWGSEQQAMTHQPSVERRIQSGGDAVDHYGSRVGYKYAGQKQMRLQLLGHSVVLALSNRKQHENKATLTHHRKMTMDTREVPQKVAGASPNNTRWKGSTLCACCEIYYRLLTVRDLPKNSRQQRASKSAKPALYPCCTHSRGRCSPST